MAPIKNENPEDPDLKFISDKISEILEDHSSQRAVSQTYGVFMRFPHRADDIVEILIKGCPEDENGTFGITILNELISDSASPPLLKLLVRHREDILKEIFSKMRMESSEVDTARNLRDLYDSLYHSGSINMLTLPKYRDLLEENIDLMGDVVFHGKASHRGSGKLLIEVYENFSIEKRKEVFEMWGDILIAEAFYYWGNNLDYLKSEILPKLPVSQEEISKKYWKVIAKRMTAEIGAREVINSFLFRIIPEFFPNAEKQIYKEFGQYIASKWNKKTEKMLCEAGKKRFALATRICGENPPNTLAVMKEYMALEEPVDIDNSDFFESDKPYQTGKEEGYYTAVIDNFFPSNFENDPIPRSSLQDLYKNRQRDDKRFHMRCYHAINHYYYDTVLPELYYKLYNAGYAKNLNKGFFEHMPDHYRNSCYVEAKRDSMSEEKYNRCIKKLKAGCTREDLDEIISSPD